MLGVVHGGFGMVVYWVQASLGLTLGMDVPQHGHLDVRAEEDDAADASAEAYGGVRAVEDGRTSTSRRLRGAGRCRRTSS